MSCRSVRTKQMQRSSSNAWISDLRLIIFIALCNLFVLHTLSTFLFVHNKIIWGKYACIEIF